MRRTKRILFRWLIVGLLVAMTLAIPRTASAGTVTPTISDWNTGVYTGFMTTADTFWTVTSPTNEVTATETFQVAVDYTKPAGTYTCTVYYIATPKF